MPSFLLRRSLLKRVAPGLPVGAMLASAEIALLAGRHLGNLDAAQRRRLLALVAQARGRPGSLGEQEREELLALISLLQPRLFVGTSVRRLSPVPLPKRLLYGPRGGAARSALRRDRGA